MKSYAVRFIRRAGRVIPIRVAAEAAGLALLAGPTLHDSFKKRSIEKKKAIIEFAGLSVLTAAALAPAVPRAAKLVRALGRLRRMRGV